MKFLVETVESYRVDTEKEVAELLDEAKKDDRFILNKYDCVKKEKTAKGEVVDSWFRVSLKKKFTDEKDPDVLFKISYKEGEAD